MRGPLSESVTDLHDVHHSLTGLVLICRHDDTLACRQPARLHHQSWEVGPFDNRWPGFNRCRIERFYCRTTFVRLNGGCLSTAAALWLLSPSKCSTLSVSVARIRHNHHIFTSLTPSSIPESKLLTISFSIMAPLLCLMAPKPNKHFYWKTSILQELISWNVGLSAVIAVSVCTDVRMKLQACWGSVKEP